MTYLWLKAIHLIGVIAYLAGIFYIWRLFVYHSETSSQDVREQLAIMETRLLRYIMRPAAVIALGFGLALLIGQWSTYATSTWIYIKLVLVTGIIVNHGLAEHYCLRLARGEPFGSRRFRLLNEMPTVLMIPIVILAVLKDSLWQ